MASKKEFIIHIKYVNNNIAVITNTEGINMTNGTSIVFFSKIESVSVSFKIEGGGSVVVVVVAVC